MQLLNLLSSRCGRLAISKDDLFREILLHLGTVFCNFPCKGSPTSHSSRTSMPVHSVSIKLRTSVIALASSLLLLVMSINAKLNIYDDEKVLNFAKGLLEVIFC